MFFCLRFPVPENFWFLPFSSPVQDPLLDVHLAQFFGFGRPNQLKKMHIDPSKKYKRFPKGCRSLIDLASMSFKSLAKFVGVLQNWVERQIPRKSTSAFPKGVDPSIVFPLLIALDFSWAKKFWPKLDWRAWCFCKELCVKSFAADFSQKRLYCNSNQILIPHRPVKSELQIPGKIGRGIHTWYSWPLLQKALEIIFWNIFCKKLCWRVPIFGIKTFGCFLLCRFGNI